MSVQDPGAFLLENHKQVALENFNHKTQQIEAAHGASKCPEVRGPFFCTAKFKVEVIHFPEVKITGYIYYPKGKTVKIEGEGEVGTSLSSDLDCHVAGLLGPDSEQILGEVAWSVGGASTGIGPINLALMKPGCFIGDLFGLVFGAGAVVVAGRATITPA